MTWIVPLLARTSVFTTFVEPFRKTDPPRTWMLIFGPASVFVDLSFTTLAAVTLPLTTWYRSTRRRAFGLTASCWSVAFGTAANAASVGAKTVSGPGAESAPTRPARLAARAAS